MEARIPLAIWAIGPMEADVPLPLWAAGPMETGMPLQLWAVGPDACDGSTQDGKPLGFVGVTEQE